MQLIVRLGDTNNALILDFTPTNETKISDVKRMIQEHDFKAPPPERQNLSRDDDKVHLKDDLTLEATNIKENGCKILRVVYTDFSSQYKNFLNQTFGRI